MRSARHIEKIRLISVALFLVSIFTLSSCGIWPVGFIFDYHQALTDRLGTAVLSTSTGIIEAKVKDQNGALINNALVESFDLEDFVLITVKKDNYLPGFQLIDKDSFVDIAQDLPRISASSVEAQIAVVTIVIVIITVAKVVATFIEYSADPGEFFIQWPGVVEGSRKVRTVCFQVDPNDILNVIDIVSSAATLINAVQVFGAPAKLRGVTAINLGFTHSAIRELSDDLIFQEFLSFLGILQDDLWVTCEYNYGEGRNEKAISIQRWIISRSSTVAQSWPTFQHDSQRSGRSQFFGPVTDNLDWFYFDNAMTFRELTVTDQGSIYVGAGDNSSDPNRGVYLIEDDGNSITFNLDPFVLSSPLITPTGNVVVIDMERSVAPPFVQLVAYSPDLQNELWRSQAFSTFFNGAELVQGVDGNIYYLTQCTPPSTLDRNTSLVALNPTSGTVQWIYDMDTGNTVHNEPCGVHRDDNNTGSSAPPTVDLTGNIFFARHENLVGVDSNGNEILAISFPDTPVQSIVVADHDTMYVTVASTLYSIDLNNLGAVNWTKQITGLQPFVAVGAGENIFASTIRNVSGSNKGALFAVRSSDGSIAWDKDFSFTATISTPIVGADGIVYVSTANAVKAYTPDGQFIWEASQCELKSNHAARESNNLVISSDGSLLVSGGRTICSYSD